MYFFLGIDPAKDNIGLVLCKADNNNIEPLAAIRVAYCSDKKFIQELINLIYIHNVEVHKLNVSIERQPHQSSISSNMRFVQGYLTAIGAKVVMKMSITYGQHIKKYSERKNYSIRRAIERLNSSEVKNQSILIDALNCDYRKHDIADGFNLAYDLWNEFRQSSC